MARTKHDPDQMHFPSIDLDLQKKLDFATAAASKSGKKKKTDTESGPLNLGKAVKVIVPDFSNPKRPKTCLEVDFPIVPINALSQLEGNAGKPIYQMSKWWARRRSSVFRAMLIAAAMQAPIKTKADGSPELDADGIPFPDITEASRAVWDVYYANHQKADNFRHLKVLDCFMGGGTTLVEGSRLGFQVAGVDLNPVAWFVVKNELACTDPEEVRQFFDQIEAEVKPVIQPFYVTECPRGHKGRWFRVDSSFNRKPEACAEFDSAKSGGADAHASGLRLNEEPMPDGFDPLTLAPEDRKQYRYAGSEVIYTFWAKHGPCSRLGCGHRTPIFRSPVIAEKKLGVKYIPLTCKKCKTEFHAELGAARMAPAAERVVLASESPFTELSQPFAQRLADYSKGKAAERDQRINELCGMVDAESGLRCPKCGEFSGQYLRDVLNKHNSAGRRADIDKKHLNIQPPRNGTKHVFNYLLVDPDWIKGGAGVINSDELGGYADATVAATSRWYEQRLENLRLIEVRGRIKLAEDTSHLGVTESETVAEVEDEEVPDESEAGGEAEEADGKEYGLPRFITLADGRRIDTRKSTIPAKSHFTCGKCGLKQDVRESVESVGHGAPVAAHAIQGYCSDCDAEGRVYGGRYFAGLGANDCRRLVAAEREWNARRDADLADFWPREELPHTYMTHHANFAMPRLGYTHWWKFFNSRQLLVHSMLGSAIDSVSESGASQDAVMALHAAAQQYLQNQSTFCHYEVGWDKLAVTFANSNFRVRLSHLENNFSAPMGRGNWRACVAGVIEGLDWARSPSDTFIDHSTGKSEKVFPGDPIVASARVDCASSSEMPFHSAHEFDLVITDPPFGDNIFYSDLSNFFHAWLRLPLRHDYPELFEQTKTPNAQEALAPRLLSKDEANDYYRIRLTACWAESCRVLKDGGLLAFTFHHSEPAQWAIVLESLFDAGFLLEQTFPIASDEQKGEGGQFGAKGTEYDIIHVCRKRLAEPMPVSWAKMRQWVKAELSRLKELLVAYKANEISEADIRVILRGKALEFYSRHYGQVFTSDNEPLSIRHALGGIDQLLDEGSSGATGNPPSIVQPAAYQYLRLFTIAPSRKAEDVGKTLFGTAIRQRDFEDRGWVKEANRRVTATPILQRFESMRLRPRKEMKTEIDQAHFMIGSALPNSGVSLEQELTKDSWMVRRSVDAVLEWYAKMAPESDIREAAELARTILRQTLDRLRQQPVELDRQLKLFNDWDEGISE
jgi:putative DNA methylase